MSDEPIRIALVDDHEVVRRGLTTFLGLFDDLEVVGEATDGSTAIALIERLRAAGSAPDVVLMDLAMQPVDGVEATRLVRERWSEVEVVIVTSFAEEERAHAALEAGASGFVIKDAAPEEIAIAIRAAHAGEVHVDARLTRRLLASLRERDTTVDPLEGLTSREREVLALVACGHANKEIARRLVITERTARTHVSSILRKLGLTSRTQAALLAVREGHVVPEP